MVVLLRERPRIKVFLLFVLAMWSGEMMALLYYYNAQSYGGVIPESILFYVPNGCYGSGFEIVFPDSGLPRIRKYKYLIDPDALEAGGYVKVSKEWAMSLHDAIPAFVEAIEKQANLLV